MKANEIKQSDFRVFAENIYQKTSIKISIFSDTGVCLFGEDYPINIEEFNGDIFLDKKKNIYLFQFEQLGKTYYAVISGNEKKETVVLIKELARYSLINKSEMTLNEFYTSVIHGEMTYSETTRYSEAFSIPDYPCGALIVTFENGKAEDIINVLETYIEKNDTIIKLSNKEIVITKFITVQDEIEHSFNEFAEFILQFVYEETGIKCKLFMGGIVRKVYDLSVSFSQALSTERICNSLSVKGSIHNYKEYVIFKMLEDLPKYKLSEYLDSLIDYIDNGIFEDSEMLSTAEEFLENNLNISETSRKMFLHRNTLTYRLDKIERETGLDVRKFSDAVTFRLITLIKKLLK